MLLFRILLICVFIVGSPLVSLAQVDALWLDIGDLHNLYVPEGAVVEEDMQNLGMQWPANIRFSGHTRSEAFWIGVKDWTDEEGVLNEYQVIHHGPRNPSDAFVAVEHRLVSKWPETMVSVNGNFAGSNEQIIDDVNPDLPADRMIVSRLRTALGIEVERKAYAFGNAYHDDYHIIERTFTNTGNTDTDDDIELPGQTVTDAYFFNIWRWTGRVQASFHGSMAQRWGKFNMVDVVGDGHEQYPVDFTAIYSWAGYDPAFLEWNNLGSPMINPQELTAPTDTIGRMAGMSMQGMTILHADNSESDQTYDQAVQPKAMGFVDMDDIFAGDGYSHSEFYQIVILGRENPDYGTGGAFRMFPHYADRIEPEGLFWEPSFDASLGKQGGHGSTVAYGPYTLDINQQVRVVEALVADGLSYDAATQIGRAFKRSGADDEALIEFDANGDGVISDTPFDYSSFNNGAERMTKNQWFMTTRDSMFASMQLAKEVWDRSDEMDTYLFDAVPPPPQFFEITSTRTAIGLRWETHIGVEDPVSWEVYRTSEYLDNHPYELLATLPGSTRSLDDTDVVKNTDYFYYLQAVGEPTVPDSLGITGTSTGAPFKSGLYYTQTFVPARLASTVDVPAIGAVVEQNSPNPFSESTTIPYAINGPDFVKITVVDLVGREVITLVDDFFNVDFAEDIVWDGRDNTGKRVPSGVYYCYVTTTFGRDVIPMVVVR